ADQAALGGGEDLAGALAAGAHQVGGGGVVLEAEAVAERVDDGGGGGGDGDDEVLAVAHAAQDAAVAPVEAADAAVGAEVAAELEVADEEDVDGAVGRRELGEVPAVAAVTDRGETLGEELDAGDVDFDAGGAQGL